MRRVLLAATLAVAAVGAISIVGESAGVSDAEAAQIFGGCVNLETTSWCGNDTSCEAAIGYGVESTDGSSKVSKRTNCTTSSCGSYITLVNPCSGS